MCCHVTHLLRHCHLLFGTCSGHCLHEAIASKTWKAELVLLGLATSVEFVTVDCSTEYGTPTIWADIMAWDEEVMRAFLAKFPLVDKVWEALDHC